MAVYKVFGDVEDQEVTKILFNSDDYEACIKHFDGSCIFTIADGRFKEVILNVDLIDNLIKALEKLKEVQKSSSQS